MGRIVFHIGLMLAGTLTLAGCGMADSHSSMPEFLRVKEGGPPPLEPPPDVKQLVRDHLDSVFMASSAPHDVQVSPARHNLRGPGWIACVKADLNSATGKPLGMQTYRIDIEEGVILDRQRDEDSDSCACESFERL
jgi:hypothetical protein